MGGRKYVGKERLVGFCKVRFSFNKRGLSFFRFVIGIFEFWRVWL